MNKQEIGERLISCFLKSKEHYYDMSAKFEDLVEPLFQKIRVYADDTFKERYDNMRVSCNLNNENFIALHFKKDSTLYIYYVPTDWLWLNDEELREAVTDYGNLISNYW